MALSKFHVGDLIKIVNEKNDCKLKDFHGVNINKEFMPTAADTNGLDESKYKVVRKKRFVFSGMQTGRDSCIRISMYQEDNPIIVSPAYTTFEIINSNLILPMYFFMNFLSKEKDRLGAFYSDGSIRTNLDWERFCDIELNVPPIDVQKKYVDIYEGLLENLKSYEAKLEDLKLVCNGYIEELRKKYPLKCIGDYIAEVRALNSDNKFKKVLGVNSNGVLSSTKANLNGVDLTKYKICLLNDFAYNPSRINVGSIALNDTDNCIISPMYIVFKVTKLEDLNPYYLKMWLHRKEFLRSTLFYALGSVRDTFSYDLMSEVKIPIPSIKVQNSIVGVFKAYNERKEFIEKIKQIISNICPVLVKGAIEEGKGR